MNSAPVSLLPIKLMYYPTVDAALSDLEKVVDNLFKDSKMLQKMMHKQHSIQHCVLVCGHSDWCSSLLY
jgi:glutamine synthetase adenylyltransferase